jgi:hypothetical protein
MATGIFFHYQQGERLKDFPQALQGILEREDVFFYDAYYPSKPESLFDLPPIPADALYRTHSKEMVERVKRAGAYEGAAIAIRELETRNPALRFTVIDTDVHHGDGSWELFEHDPNVLYVCFCPAAFEERNSNVNIEVPFGITDDEYIRLVTENLQERTKNFGTELIFWNWGYDGTVGEYGDIGLSPHLHVRVASEIKKLAEEFCKGRLIVVLCGGSRRDRACLIIPRVIGMLVG